MPDSLRYARAFTKEDAFQARKSAKIHSREEKKGIREKFFM